MDKLFRKICSFVYSILINLLRIIDHKWFGLVIKKLVIWFSEKISNGRLSFRQRQIVSLAQPTNPLKSKMLPTINIAIPCHTKDFESVSLAINGAINCVKNPIGKIGLITPYDSVKILESRFPDYEVSSDENILGTEIINLVNSLLPKERQGWIFQQLIKFLMAKNSSEIATLVVDADTVLLHPKVWINSSGTQILCLANEFHLPYKYHQRRVFGGNHYPLSFVTHHQLMKQESLNEIFGVGDKGIARWLKLADYSENSPISEYDTYGEWMITNRPEQIIFSKWNNIAVKLGKDNNDYAKVLKSFSKYGSISNHTYLR